VTSASRAVLGTGAFADAFFAVLQLTNVFRRLLAEGALNAAFVPVWLRIKAAHGEGGADRVFSRRCWSRCCSPPAR
jgi:putative peptidoglycan lipid II flippase